MKSTFNLAHSVSVCKHGARKAYSGHCTTDFPIFSINQTHQVVCK
jgi:hypothetical protein